MGNESGDGPNAAAAYQWTKQRDPSRPFHYEGTTSHGGSQRRHQFLHVSHAGEREAARGAASGDAADPLRILARHGQLQRRPEGILGHLLFRHQRAGRIRLGLGGSGNPRCPCPGEYKANTSKSTFLAYGGWWEDKTGIRNDNDFNNNGLVSADRIPHPGLYAIKYVYRNLHVIARWISRTGASR